MRRRALFSQVVAVNVALICAAALAAALLAGLDVNETARVLVVEREETKSSCLLIKLLISSCIVSYWLVKNSSLFFTLPLTRSNP
jgi:hypothetical protein